MPQPLSTKLNKRPHMAFYTDSGLQKRPALGLAFAEAIEQFAVCEGSIGALYLVLNAHRPEEAYTELTANVTFSSRVSMVRTCADQLENRDRALVLAVTDRSSTAAGMRNKITHCTWGYSDALPDAVLLIPTSSGLRDIRERLKGRLGMMMQREASEVGVMVYEQRDFDSVRNAAIDAFAPLDIVAGYIMSTAEQRARFREQILSDPQTNARYEKRLSAPRK